MRENKSIWRTDTELKRRGRLEKELKTDVAVIGAGMAGLLIAHRLRRRGISAVVLDAGRVAGGQTKGTTAKITAQHGVIYDALIRKFGEEKAAQYARANGLAIREFADIIRENDIDCGFREVPSYVYTEKDAEPLIVEAGAARGLGIDAVFVDDVDLPFKTAGAVRFDRQAQFHPLRFIEAISRDMEIYEGSRALAVEGNDVVTERGALRAGSVVFAAHYPFVNVPGWYFMRMHQERSYVMALESDWLPNGMYYGADEGGLSFREADGLLLLGGEGHRTGENSAGGQYAALHERAREMLPGCREVARWSAQDCVTLDGVPYIGRYSASAPNWYVATGFAKWGMSSSMAASMIIGGMISGDTPDFAEVFSPSRLKLSASAKSLATETAQAFKGLSREFLSFPRSTLDGLPLGHGGIVESDGRKAGIYKDERGQCYIVEPRCPHLGCQLEWNPEELSWDCPCHGSRFSYDGGLINGPAQKGLVK